MKHCYQCDREVDYLFDDGRGKCCTRLTPEEAQGLVSSVDDEEEEDENATLH